MCEYPSRPGKRTVTYDERAVRYRATSPSNHANLWISWPQESFKYSGNSSRGTQEIARFLFFTRCILAAFFSLSRFKILFKRSLTNFKPRLFGLYVADCFK